MPKERRDRSVSFDRSRASPFPCGSSHSLRSLAKNPLENEENVEEWEEARCPVCMEHPHNAILLMCSSHDKGCRPFMCDTSYRHSNCFDQFRKSFVETSPTMPRQEESPESTVHLSLYPMIPEAMVTDFQAERSEEGSTAMHANCENQVKGKLVCPLCRGDINGWMVVDSARVFMNAKSRSCACEACDFSGSYTDLRKHARLVHPLVRPSEADPERQRDWRRLEQQRDLGDLISTLQYSIGEERSEDSTLTFDEGLERQRDLGVRLERQRDLGDLISTLQSSIGEERSEDNTLTFDEGGWLTVFFLIRVFRPGSSSRSSSLSGTSRARRVTVRRRRPTTRLWGESYDGDSRDQENESSDGGSGPRRERILQRPTPDEES